MFMSSVLGRVVRPPSAAYAASKWALEALVEALALEAAPFGVQAALLGPGAVSSAPSTTSRPTRCPTILTPQSCADGGSRSGMITPNRSPSRWPHAAEKPQLPLRIPIGDAARTLLAARHAAPDDAPFVAATLLMRPFQRHIRS